MSVKELKEIGVKNPAQVIVYGICLACVKNRCVGYELYTAFTKKSAKEYIKLYKQFDLNEDVNLGRDADYLTERILLNSSLKGIDSRIYNLEQVYTSEFVDLCNEILEKKKMQLENMGEFWTIGGKS